MVAGKFQVVVRICGFSIYIERELTVILFHYFEIEVRQFVVIFSFDGELDVSVDGVDKILFYQLQISNFINSINTDIKFTVETENNNKLPYLDLEIVKQNNG